MSVWLQHQRKTASQSQKSQCSEPQADDSFFHSLHAPANHRPRYAANGKVRSPISQWSRNFPRMLESCCYVTEQQWQMPEDQIVPKWEMVNSSLQNTALGWPFYLSCGCTLIRERCLQSRLLKLFTGMCSVFCMNSESTHAGCTVTSTEFCCSASIFLQMTQWLDSNAMWMHQDSAPVFSITISHYALWSHKPHRQLAHTDYAPNDTNINPNKKKRKQKVKD